MSSCVSKMPLDLQLATDSWFYVEDPKKRKQIQDRLAQRARRKRLADLKHRRPDASKRCDNSDQNAADGRVTATVNQRPVSPPSSNSEETTSPSSTISSTSFSSATERRPSETIGSDFGLSLQHTPSVMAALFTNGQLLGLRCGIQVPILSPPCTAKIPLSLHPTCLQMTVLHVPWIDRFPFPVMRDNAIRLSCKGFNEEEFFADIFTRDSFIMAPNAVSWDPDAWVMTPAFEDRWGFLFH